MLPGRKSMAGSVSARRSPHVIARHRRAVAAPPRRSRTPAHSFQGRGRDHAYARRWLKALQNAVDPMGSSAGTGPAGRSRPRQPRDLLSLKSAGRPVPSDEVEPATPSRGRFVSSAMSLGACRREAHQAISIGMARLGGSANLGEGGEDPAWLRSVGGWRPSRCGDQAGRLARFGVTRVHGAGRSAESHRSRRARAPARAASCRAKRRRPSSPACAAGSGHDEDSPPAAVTDILLDRGPRPS